MIRSRVCPMRRSRERRNWTGESRRIVVKQPEPKNRRFQLTLRQLLLATAVVGLLCAFATHQLVQYRHSRSVAWSVAKLGGSVSWRGPRISDVRFLDPRLDADGWQELSKIPYGFCLQVDGRTFTSQTMNELVRIKHLEYLVLHNTRVQEQDVIDFQQQRPDVRVTLDVPGKASHSHKEFPANIP